MTGVLEEAVLEMYLSGVSTRRIAGITDALSPVKVGRDTVSRIAARLEGQQRASGGRGARRKLIRTCT